MKLNIRFVQRTFRCAYDHLANTKLVEDVGLWLDCHATTTMTDEVSETVDLVKRVIDALPGTARARDLENWLRWHDRPEQPALDPDDVVQGLYSNLAWFAEVQECDLTAAHHKARQALRRALWFGHDE